MTGVDFSPVGLEKAGARPCCGCRTPGSVFVMWCFYDEIPWWKRRGARFPGLAVGDERRLFGASFDVERLPEPASGSGFACFLMRRS